MGVGTWYEDGGSVASEYGVGDGLRLLLRYESGNEALRKFRQPLRPLTLPFTAVTSRV